MISESDFLADIERELAVSQICAAIDVAAVEWLDDSVAKVAYAGNRQIDAIRDRLEGGSAWQADVDSSPTWSIIQLGDEAGEADVMFLAGIARGSIRLGSRLLLRPFNFIQPLQTILRAPQWTARWKQLYRQMAGRESPTAVQPGDKVFCKDLTRAWNSSLGLVWGPPGTGKTWTLGNQVAYAAEPAKRVLVVSTTNDATDLVAAEIASALARMKAQNICVKRVGTGLRRSKFLQPQDDKFRHPEVLPEDQPEAVAEVQRLESELASVRSANKRAVLKSALLEARRRLGDHATRYFLDDRCHVVVTTSYKALACLAGEGTAKPIRARSETAPIFDTICVDEAGLLAAPVVAALSPLSRRRVVLFGDPCQLAPIAKVSAELKVSSMSAVKALSSCAVLLDAQRRMDPLIRSVVSSYCYLGKLRDKGLSSRRLPDIPAALRPGSVQLVLLDDVRIAGGYSIPLPNLRAELGPNRKSYRRTGTAALLESMLECYPALGQISGAFISPFRAQVSFIRESVGRLAPAWRFSTVHAQQGGEAPLVIVDTVDVSKVKDWRRIDPGPGISEWQRLLNVAVSRGQRSVLILTSRQEWNSSELAHVRLLRAALTASVGRDCAVTWEHSLRKLIDVDPGVAREVPRMPDRPEGSLGERIEATCRARPILTAEQQAIAMKTDLDGNWLVHGVAGTGKTLVMAEWAVRTKKEHPSARVVIVYFTAELGSVIKREVRDACARNSMPGGVEVLHFHREVLRVKQERTDWQGEAACAARLASASPAFGALFVDEAQDFGVNGLNYLIKLVSGYNFRFLLDPMQGTQNRPLTWSSVFQSEGNNGFRVLKLLESHRTTRQIGDMAINLFARMGGDIDPLLQGGLATSCTVGQEAPLLRNEFVGHDGEAVEVKVCTPGTRGDTRGPEMDWVAERILRLIHKEGVRPHEIGIVINNFYLKGNSPCKHFADLWRNGLMRRLAGKVAFEGRDGDDQVPIILLQSAKGLEYEVVIMAAADTLAPHPESNRKLRAEDLYTAATRARQKLIISGTSFSSAVCQTTGVNVLEAAVELASAFSSPEWEALSC